MTDEDPAISVSLEQNRNSTNSARPHSSSQLSYQEVVSLLSSDDEEQEWGNLIGNSLHQILYNNNNNNNNGMTNFNYNGPARRNQTSLDRLLLNNNDNDVDSVQNAILNAEFTPTSSQESSSYLDDIESLRFPSQDSNFFSPASPTYSPSLPRMSQSSQDSITSISLSPDPIASMENQYIFSENSEFNLSGSDSSQPEAKRMRLDQ